MQPYLITQQFNQLHENLQIQRPETSKYSSMSRRHNRMKTQMRNTSTNWAKQINPDSSPTKNSTLQKRKSSHYIKNDEKVKQLNNKSQKAELSKPGITLQEYFLSQTDHKQPFAKGFEDDLNDDIGFFCENFMIQEKDQDDEDTKETAFNNSQLRVKYQKMPSKDKIKILDNHRRQISEDASKNFNIRNITNGWKPNQNSKQKPYNKQDLVNKVQKSKTNKKATAADFYKNIQHKLNYAQFQCSQEYLLQKYGNKFNLTRDSEESNFARKFDKLVNRTRAFEGAKFKLKIK